MFSVFSCSNLLFVCLFVLKFGLGIKKEIEIVNKKHTEQQMALQRCKRDSQASKPIEKEILDLKKRQEFLKSNLMLERCNDALQRDRRQLEMLKNSQQIEDEMKMEMGWP